MPTVLWFGLPIAIGIVVAAVSAAAMAPRLSTPLRITAALVFLPLAGFCLFGLAATFEPGAYHLVWRLLYAIVVLACLAALARLVLAGRQHVERERG